MEAIKTETTNGVLRGNGETVVDLPVTFIQFGDGLPGIESCWELSDEELEEVKRTGVIYFLCIGNTHPPICLSPYSSLSGKVEGQYDTAVNFLTVCKKNPGPSCKECQENTCPGWNR